MKNTPTVQKVSLIHKVASRFSVEPEKLLGALKATAFRQQKGGEISDAQMMALMVVSDQYGLNPFTKELYAYPDKQGGIVPVVSVDGWTRIINSNAMFQGVQFSYSEDIDEPAHGKPCPAWIECSISRKDRDKPVVVREYLDECYRTPFKRDDGSMVNGPWQTHTKRMLRHKALIQCSRLAFGFGGIYDDDEAHRIIERDITPQMQLIEGPKAKSAKRIETFDERDAVDDALRELEQQPAVQHPLAGQVPATPASAAPPANTPPNCAPEAAGPQISADQHIHLADMLTDARIKPERLLAAMAKANIGAETLAKLPAASYERAVAWIHAAVAAQAKREHV